MEQTWKRNLLAGIVTSCTGLNMLLGLASLLAASRGQMQMAAWCILIAVLSDGADGYLARKWNVTSDFGVQLDSLADMTSFNVAGGVLTYFWFSPQVCGYFAGGAAALYVFMGACRLARFNVGVKRKDEFQGLATTAAAILLAVIYLTCPEIDATLGVVLVATLALLMVSVFPYPKLVKILSAPLWLWPLLVAAANFNFHWTVWACSLAYLASGPFTQIMRRGRPPEDWEVQH